jgi:hypothetical protein
MTTYKKCKNSGLFLMAAGLVVMPSLAQAGPSCKVLNESGLSEAALKADSAFAALSDKVRGELTTASILIPPGEMRERIKSTRDEIFNFDEFAATDPRLKLDQGASISLSRMRQMAISLESKLPRDDSYNESFNQASNQSRRLAHKFLNATEPMVQHFACLHSKAEDAKLVNIANTVITLPVTVIVGDAPNLATVSDNSKPKELSPSQQGPLGTPPAVSFSGDIKEASATAGR